MLRVNTHEAKTQLSKLLALVEKKQETIQICRNGKPIADLRPSKPTQDPLRRNPKLRGVKFLEDPMLPLDDEDWPEAFR